MSIQIRMTDYAWNGTALLSPGDTPSLDGSVAADLVNGGKAMYISERESNKEMSDVKANVDPVTGEIVFSLGGSTMLPQPAGSFVIVGDSITEQNTASVNLTSLTQTGGVATATLTGHGLSDGQKARVYYANESGYNGEHTVTWVDANTFTFPVDASTPSPATVLSGKTAIRATRSTRLPDNGYFNWFQTFSGNRARLLSNAGMGGQRTDEILARLDDSVFGVTGYKPQYCVILCGINDVFASVATDTIKANLQAIWAKLLGNGITVVAGTILPLGSSHGSFSAANIQKILAINAFIRKTATSRRGMILWDSAADIVDYTQTDGRADSTKLKTDYIHPNAKGARAMGLSLYNLLSSRLPAQSTLVSSAADSYDIDATNSQLLANPLLTGSGGTAGTGASGTIAASWEVGRAAGSGATTTCSVVARDAGTHGDAIGNVQRAVIASAVASDVVQIRNATSIHGRVAAGDTVYAECHLRAVSMSNVSYVKFFILANVSANLHYSETMLDSAGYENSDFSGTLRTPDFKIPAGITALRAYVYVRFAGAGGATIDLGRVSLRKVS